MGFHPPPPEIGTAQNYGNVTFSCCLLLHNNRRNLPRKKKKNIRKCIPSVFRVHPRSLCIIQIVRSTGGRRRRPRGPGAIDGRADCSNQRHARADGIAQEHHGRARGLSHRQDQIRGPGNRRAHRVALR